MKPMRVKLTFDDGTHLTGKLIKETDDHFVLLMCNGSLKKVPKQGTYVLPIIEKIKARIIKTS